MKKSVASESSERLKRVLMQDKLSNPARLSEIIKEEIVFVLSSYMDILSRDIEFFVSVDDNGLYSIDVRAKARRIYSVRH